MSISWDAITPEGQALTEPLTGPPLVLPGEGFRLVLLTPENPENRNENLLIRLNAAVGYFVGAGIDGFSEEPLEGYSKVNGGGRHFFVRGSDERQVYTTLARALLAADRDIADKVRGLGIRALREW